MAETAPAATPAILPTVPEAATAPAIDSAPVETVARMMKLRLDDLGDLDLPEADVLKLAAHAAKTTHEDKKAARELEALKARFLEDPEAVMAEFGLDPDARAEARLSKRLQAELDDVQLSSEAKEARDLKAKLAKYEAAEKEKAERELKTREAAALEQHRNHYGAVIKSALESTSLPTTPALAKRMAAMLEKNLSNGLEIPAPMLAKLVEQEVAAEHTSLFTELDAEKLFDRIGEANVKKLIKAFAKRQGLQPVAAPAAPAAPAKKSQSERNKEEREALRELSNVHAFSKGGR